MTAEDIKALTALLQKLEDHLGAVSSPERDRLFCMTCCATELVHAVAHHSGLLPATERGLVLHTIPRPAAASVYYATPNGGVTVRTDPCPHPDGSVSVWSER